MSEAVQNLLDFLKKIANEQGYSKCQIDLQAVSTDGANYTSGLYVVTISAPPKDDLKLFAKVANLSESVRSANYMYDIVYEKEHAFYSELVVEFKKLYDKNGVPEKYRLYIPKCYFYKYAKLEEKLVLENLAARGFKSFDRMDTFDWDYASKSVEELAKFHALGLAFKEENLEKFDMVCKNLVVDIFANKSLIEPLLSQAIKMGTEVIKEEYRDRMRTYFEANNLLDGIEKLWSPSDTGLLVHGGAVTKSIGLFIGLAFMNVLTVDPKEVPDLEDFDNLKVEPNQLAKDRMNGIVGDYARWGII